jgi:hypothetical protein
MGLVVIHSVHDTTVQDSELLLNTCKHRRSEATLCKIKGEHKM